MRTISEPARASAATCLAVPSTSAVSVLVIDWTTIGAPPPTCTLPTCTGTDWRRCSGAADWVMNYAPEVGDGVPEAADKVNLGAPAWLVTPAEPLIRAGSPE